MTTKGALNYSTTIATSKTLAEMQTMLIQHGASRIAVDYEAGAPSALSFLLVTPHGPRQFALPVNVEAMHRLLIQQAAAQDRAIEQGESDE